MVAGALIEPTRRHDPGVVALEVALLRPREGGLVPWMTLIDWITERIAGYEGLRTLPIVVVGAAEKDADVEVDIDERVGDQLAVDNHAGSNEHPASPFGHVLVLIVAVGRVVVGAPAAEQYTAAAHLFVTR